MEEKNTPQTMINNEFYDDLESEWYTRNDHPIALLRAENKIRIPWITQEIEKKIKGKATLLDIGCGGGFLTNSLAKRGHKVSGIDISEKTLEVAKKYDETKSVHYLLANAYNLPFKENTFDAVFALDVLEHVESPDKLIEEASRVLKPNGLFFFHTFNRNLLSYFLVIKGVEWFVKNTPINMHVYPLFIRPNELKNLLKNQGLIVENLQGFRPVFSSSLWKMLLTKTVCENFKFTFSKKPTTGYCGFAVKKI